jgi:hypothetical protein
MRSWQRDLMRDLNRQANEPCTCKNNGDLCPRCDARDQLNRLTQVGLNQRRQST